MNYMHVRAIIGKYERVCIAIGVCLWLMALMGLQAQAYADEGTGDSESFVTADLVLGEAEDVASSVEGVASDDEEPVIQDANPAASAVGDEGEGSLPATPVDPNAASTPEASDAAAIDDSSASSQAEEPEGSQAPLGTMATASDTLDKNDLLDGTYTVEVNLMQADDTSKSSMASGAFDTKQNLVVRDGQYKLSLEIGTIKIASITGYVGQIDYFPEWTKNGTKITAKGNAIKCWSASKKGDAGPAAVPVLDNAIKSGFVLVQLHSDQMPVSPQKAAFKINWGTLTLVSLAQEGQSSADSPSKGSSSSENAGNSSNSSDASGEDAQASVDKSKLKSSLKNARAALNRGGKAESVTAALADAVEAARVVYDDANATQSQVDSQVKLLDAATSKYTLSKDEAVSADNAGNSANAGNSGSSSSANATQQPGSSSGAAQNGAAVRTQATDGTESFQVGQTYTVPIQFTKTGTDETSMANQYFEANAEVKVLDGGKYEATITTNRSDYVTQIKYNGEALKAGAENGTKRGYTMTVPAAKSDTTYKLSMAIKPMQEMGGGDVDADLHMRYSQAVNKATGKKVGTSTSSSTPSSTTTSTSSSPSQSSSSSTTSSMPKTGDTLPAIALIVAAIASAVLGAFACKRMHGASRLW